MKEGEQHIASVVGYIKDGELHVSEEMAKSLKETYHRLEEEQEKTDSCENCQPRKTSNDIQAS